MYIFPSDSTFIIRKILEGILASKRSHTRGNPDIEILQSVENPEKLFRIRGKEKINISQFGASSSQEFHNIQDFRWGTNFERSFLKSKSKSDLKETEINPSRLESYFLDSLGKTFKIL